MDHSSTVARLDHILARLAAAPPAAAAALRRLALNHVSIRAARAFFRVGFSAARASRKTPAIPYDPASAVDDGGAAAAFAGRASPAFASWIAATHFTTRAKVRFRFSAAPAAGTLSDSSYSLPACLHREQRRMAFARIL